MDCCKEHLCMKVRLRFFPPLTIVPSSLWIFSGGRKIRKWHVFNVNDVLYICSFP